MKTLKHQNGLVRELHNCCQRIQKQQNPTSTDQYAACQPHINSLLELFQIRFMNILRTHSTLRKNKRAVAKGDKGLSISF